MPNNDPNSSNVWPSLAQLRTSVGNVRPGSMLISVSIVGAGLIMIAGSIALVCWLLFPGVLRGLDFTLAGGIVLLGCWIAERAFRSGYSAVEIGRKRIARNEARIVDDRRPYVLYLRSFKEEVTTSRFVPRFGLLTEEQHLSHALGGLGPLLAIGMPGEPLPQLGANRVMVDEAHWRSVVIGWIRRASLIVLRVGNTPSFWWEVRQVFRLADPTKVIFVAPHGRARYEEFANALERLRPGGVNMPSYVAAATESGVSIAGFVAFDVVWQASWHALPLPRPGLAQVLQPLSVPMTRALRAALRLNLHHRVRWSVFMVAMCLGLGPLVFCLVLLTFLVAVMGFLTFVWLEFERVAQGALLVDMSYFIGMFGVATIAATQLWRFRLTSDIGPVWPGSRRPGENPLAYANRLYRTRQMQEPPAADRESLLREALSATKDTAVVVVPLDRVERSFYAACGYLGADHPDLLPVLSRLSSLYASKGAAYDAVWSQAAAVRIARRFFGHGHVEESAASGKLNSLLAIFPGQHTDKLTTVVGHMHGEGS